MRSAATAEKSDDPVGSGLCACYEAFGTKNASALVDVAGEGVDGYDVGGFLVPGTVFEPVGCGDFIPAVVEGVVGGENAHGESRRLGLVDDGGEAWPVRVGSRVGPIKKR